jgi:predicted ATPase/transcriptional regulator with XRE-family HTH domain
MKFTEPFGKWLKERRKALDLTQKDLAEQVACAEITVRKLEANAYRPSKQIIERLVDILVIAPDDRAAFMRFARGFSDQIASLDLTALTLSHNLPPQTTPFIGRTSELATICAMLSNANCRLLSLVGPGGIGKTRLALQAAVDQIPVFAHGVYFVSLTSVSNAELIAAEIAAALQISLHGAEAPDAQVIHYLRSKHALLIVDNFEHLLEDSELLTNMLRQAPKLKLVVTTREKLNIQEEWALPVEGLTVPDGNEQANACTYDAIELFVQSALRIQPTFALQSNIEAVIDICKAVEGMPLGIELAASWLRAMTCQQIAAHTRYGLDFLASPLRNVPARHRSLCAVFDHSWQLLSTTERDVMSSLTVFHDGFDLEAAARVAFAALPTLASLVDKSMIRLRETGRYEIHELLRQYAEDKLIASGKLDIVCQRHLEYFVELVEKVEANLFGTQYLAVLHQMKHEHNNIRAALECALESRQFVCGLRLASVMGWFWGQHGDSNEIARWLEHLLDISDMPVALRAKALRHLILLYYHSVGFERVPAMSATLLAMVPELEDPKLIAWIYVTAGYAEYPTLAQCEAYMEKGLALFRQLNDAWGICWTLNFLAQKLFQRGEFGRAGDMQEEGIKLARKVGDKSILCSLIHLKACNIWYQAPGKIDQHLIDMYHESLMLFQEIGSKYGSASVLFQLAKLACLQGDPEQARNLHEKSLLLAEQVGGLWFLVTNLVALAERFCNDDAPELGTRILGCVAPITDKIYVDNGFSIVEVREQYQRAIRIGQERLGDAFESIFDDGKSFTLDWAVATALDKASINGHVLIS